MGGRVKGRTRRKNMVRSRREGSRGERNREGGVVTLLVTCCRPILSC